MRLKRLLSIIFVLGLLVIFLRQENAVFEGTSNDVDYRIEVADSLTLFYFQCPTYHWQIDTDQQTISANHSAYVPNAEHVICETRIQWSLLDETGERLILVETNRTVITQQTWGLLLVTCFFWLLIGSFGHNRKWDRLTMFTLLWAFTYIMHLISYEYLRTSFIDGTIFTLFPILAVVLILVNPRSIIPLVLLAISQLIEYWVISPYSSNHTLTITTINAIILILLMTCLWQAQRFYIDREQFYDSLAAILRVMVLILYFWAWFHKLNTDFVNPAVSCSVKFYQRLLTNFPFFPNPTWTPTALIWLTFLVEGGLPLLLLFKRTRLIAILIGIGFHGTLGLITFRDFSGLMFSLYFVFLSLEALAHIKNLRPYIFDYIPTWFQQLLWALMMMILIMPLPGIRFAQDNIATGLLINAIYTLLAAIITLYLLYQQWIKHDQTLSVPLFQPRPILLWYVIIFMIINGAMPYIGLKTNNAYDMYSNLRVEGHTNHILPLNFHLFPYPDDIIRILDASDNYVYNDAVDYVFQDFRETVYQQQPDFVEFARNGETFRVERGNYEGVLGARSPLILRKFMIFEPVSREINNPCSH